MTTFTTPSARKTGAWLVGLLVISTLLIIAIILLAILVARRSYVDIDANANYHYASRSKSWREAVKGSKESCPKGWNHVPLLLLSLDGFRADYLKRQRTEALDTLIENGVHSPFMYPSYPSKTFPNHYSIVTGLYPQSHGIIDNDMYDANISPPSDRTFALGTPASLNPNWWKGEPMWNTVEKNGKRSATYFWPGSSVKVQGMRPTYYKKYNESVPFEDRIGQIVDWLSLDDDLRPDFLTVYLSQPDKAGHKYGPFSHQVNTQLELVDSIIDHLMSRIFDIGLIYCINIIIVSDHGPSREQIIQNLRCRDPQLRIYTKQSIPKRLHFTKSHRIGDIIIDSDEGNYISRTNGYKKNGSHGYDFRDFSMHALFIGFGTDFRKGLQVAPFQNVELYNLMADLMSLENRATTDGSVGSLGHLMVNGPLWQVPVSSSLPSCPIVVTRATSCSSCPLLSTLTSECSTWSTGLVGVPAKQDMCQLKLCPVTIVYDSKNSMTRVISGVVSPKSNFDLSGISSCSVVDSAQTSCTLIESQSRILARDGLSLYSLLPFNEQKPVVNVLYNQMAMYDKFQSESWTWLMNLTASYASKYGQLVVINGPIFDADMDDLADNTPTSVATHVFSVLVRCDSGWNIGGSCEGKMHVLSFVLPHLPQVVNCQKPMEYLYSHTARVQDIHRLTGLSFFTELPPDKARSLYNHVNQQMWL